MSLIVAAGSASGVAISLVAFAAEHAAPAGGGYSLSGNGALILLALLAPWAVYWGWTWIVARRGEALEMALFVLGLDLGAGAWSVLDAGFFPQGTGVTPTQLLTSFVLSGSIFVVPASLVAALAYWLFSTRLPINSWTLFGAGFLAAVLVFFYWIGVGILVGICVAAARRDLPRRIHIGVALGVLLAVIGTLPFSSGLFRI